MKPLKLKIPALAGTLVAASLALAALFAQAQEKTITLCRAAWDLADALVEL